MVKDFLTSVAEYYKERCTKTDWKDICFVFPSHRAGIFFKKQLRSVLGNDDIIFGPRIITFDEFVMEKAKRLKRPLHKADNLVLAFELYKAYREIMNVGEEAMDFDRFYTWTPMFLGDFDDVDKYLIRPEELFIHLAEYSKLSDDLSYITPEQAQIIEAFWGTVFTRETTKLFENGQETEEIKLYHKRFLETYNKMLDLYVMFNNRLEEKGIAYSGRIYREVAANIEELDNDKKTKYAFVGFNALTESEVVILKHLKGNTSEDADFKEKRALFFWDYTKDMMQPLKSIKKENGRDVEVDDTMQGPGRFIRQYCQTVSSNGVIRKVFAAPKDYKLPQYEQETKQELTIKSFAYPQGQTKHVLPFLEDIVNDEETKQDSENQADEQKIIIKSNTAIVLTDENMLLPLLMSLPDNLAVNVTMGYPVKFSQAFGLIDLLMKLHRNKKYGSDGQVLFYHIFVANILQHPYIAPISQGGANNLFNTIIRDNIVNISVDMASRYGEIEQLIFRDIKASEIPEYVSNILNHIVDNIAGDDDAGIKRECILKVIKIVTRFGELLPQYVGEKAIDGITIDNAGLVLSMLCTLLQGQTVDFIGEPLRGLQIMGILETRAVDFDNLVIMDLNEGVFPKKSSAMTFLPYVIRKSYGLPTHEFQDSIFSYYFFRLINRAKRVDLLYSTITDGERNGVSRFIQQVKYEYQMTYNEEIENHATVTSEHKVLEIEKNDAVKSLMRKRYTEKYLSPSALSNYIKCPILFYYNNVLGIDEADEVLEEADSRTIGNIFHGVMEEIYGREMLKNGISTKEYRDSIDDDMLTSIILKHFDISLFMKLCEKEGVLAYKNNTSPTKIDDLTGRNIISFNIVFTLLKKMLKVDHDVRIIDVERNIRGSVKINDDLSINMGGIIDRLQEENGVCCVLDYKTGKAASTSLKIESMERFVDNLFSHKESIVTTYKAIMQTLIYCKLLYDKDPLKKYNVGIIYLKSILKSSTLDYIVRNIADNTALEYDKEFDMLFTKKLNDVISDMFGGEKFIGNHKSCMSSGHYECKFYSMCHK